MSATTSVRIMSGLMITHKSECRKAQEKSGEIGGAKKGCFWRGRREGIKQRRIVYVNAWAASVCFISQSYRFGFID